MKRTDALDKSPVHTDDMRHAVEMPKQHPKERVRNFKEVALGYDEEMAKKEAARCLQCKDPPCRKGCPVNVPIPQFIKCISEGRYAEGIATITSKKVLDIDDKQALWADYLPAERIRQWYEECTLREAEILGIVAERLESKDVNLFSYTGSQDVLKNRAGYYAALRIMQRILHDNKLPLRELFAIEKQAFFRMIKALLENQPS